MNPSPRFLSFGIIVSLVVSLGCGDENDRPTENADALIDLANNEPQSTPVTSPTQGALHSGCHTSLLRNILNNLTTP